MGGFAYCHIARIASLHSGKPPSPLGLLVQALPLLASRWPATSDRRSLYSVCRAKLQTIQQPQQREGGRAEGAWRRECCTCQHHPGPQPSRFGRSPLGHRGPPRLAAARRGAEQKTWVWQMAITHRAISSSRYPRTSVLELGPIRIARSTSEPVVAFFFPCGNSFTAFFDSIVVFLEVVYLPGWSRPSWTGEHRADCWTVRTTTSWMSRTSIGRGGLRTELQRRRDPFQVASKRSSLRLAIVPPPYFVLRYRCTLPTPTATTRTP